MMLIKDPVCDMSVSEEHAAAKSVYQGKTYYFCSTFCKQLFERSPQEYITPEKKETPAIKAE